MTGDELAEQLELDTQRVLAIIGEEHPHVLELAVRRAVIEQQRAIIEQLHAATRPAERDAG